MQSIDFMKEKIICTIGHSTHSIEKFVAMLQSFQIEMLVDIRSYPGSRRFPQFNQEALQASLPENGIQYIHLSKLGGRRKALPDSHNTAWRVEAFRGYADYMETEDFRNAIDELESIADKKRVVIVCSEAVWWSCHRSLVSDYLKLRGWQVIHIMGISKAEEHPYTKPAKIIDGRLTYSD
jgi:uncharacterized protein (DUF488 family)